MYKHAIRKYERREIGGHRVAYIEFNDKTQSQDANKRRARTRVTKPPIRYESTILPAPKRRVMASMTVRTYRTIEQEGTQLRKQPVNDTIG